MKKSKIVLVSSFALLLSLATISFNVNSAKLLLASETHNVEKGEKVAVEDRILVHGGESKTVKGQIIFPDGTYRQGNSFVANEAGLYRVSYKAHFGVEEVEENIDYVRNIVAEDFFTFSGASGSISSGEYRYNTETKKVRGAQYDITNWSTLRSKNLIDFTTLGANTPFLEFIVDPSAQSSSDIEQFTIRLTDAENEENYVDIIVKDSGPINDEGRGCYIAAGANGQQKTGYERWGSDYILHIDDPFGANVGSSFRALPETDPTATAKLYLDHSTKSLYVDPSHGYRNKQLLTDLDSQEIYKANVWEGFASGKAYLSIFSNQVNGGSGRIIIPQMGGYDLSQDAYPDVTPPRVKIDYSGQSATSLPIGKVGSPYKIFDAKAEDDFDGNPSYTVNVTYNDTENNKIKDVSVVDGAFTPLKAGEYTINYSARDSFGNTSNRRLTVRANNEYETIKVTLPSPSVEAELFDVVNLPTLEDLTITGGSGKATLERILLDNESNSIEFEGDSFVPKEVGTYKVLYIVTDYLGFSNGATYSINVASLSKPKFLEEAKLPKVLIKGHTYSIKERAGVETVNGEVKELISSVKVNGASIDGSFVAGDTCSIVYSLNGTSGTTEETINLPVVDTNLGKNQAAYFYGNFDDVSMNANDVSLSANHDASARFASLLPYDATNIYFEVADEDKNFSRLEFKYSSADDESKSLTYIVTNNGEDWRLALKSNPTVAYEFATERNTGSETMRIRFSALSKTLSDINQERQLTTIKKWDDGRDFTGFKEGVYLDISMFGANASTTLKIQTISNHDLGHRGLGDDYRDTVSPVILFKETFINTQEIGNDAFIPLVDVFDVLNDATVTLSARHPNESFILQNVDAKTRQSFKLDSFGVYNLTYAAVDAVGRRASLPRKIVVYDNVMPELEVNWNTREYYSLNDAVSIPSYKASDNTGAYTLDVYLILPNNDMRLLITDESGTVTSMLERENTIYNSSFKVNENTFRLEMKGKYELRYVLYDDAYNKISESRTFIVR